MRHLRCEYATQYNSLRYNVMINTIMRCRCGSDDAGFVVSRTRDNRSSNCAMIVSTSTPAMGSELINLTLYIFAEPHSRPVHTCAKITAVAVAACCSVVCVIASVAQYPCYVTSVNKQAAYITTSAGAAATGLLLRFTTCVMQM